MIRPYPPSHLGVAAPGGFFYNIEYSDLHETLDNVPTIYYCRYMNGMKVRNIRFSDRDWRRLCLVAVLGKMKVSEIVRRGALSYADSVTNRLKEEKKSAPEVRPGEDEAPRPEG